MAIYYHDEYSRKHGQSNFGDDINPWLLKKFLPRKLYYSKSECVVGIGTLLNNNLLRRIECYNKIHVFTTGTGYGEYDRLVGHSKINYLSVRGPMTSHALGLQTKKSITDGAILLSELIKPTRKKYKITVIPHVNTHWMSGKLLESVCFSEGLNYLVPNRNIFEFIDIVNASEMVISEAMHGAILADTLRVPWIPIKMHHALEFKWQDWCKSMDMVYQPHKIIKVYNPKMSTLALLRSEVKRHILARNLRKLSKNSGILSQQEVFDDKLQELLSLLASMN